MIWQKLGRAWLASAHVDWGEMGTLTPTPFMLPNGIIRVFCGIRDQTGVARIGFFDVHENSPTKVENFSKKPVLDIGKPGAFDDNGMLLGDVLLVENELRMYYVGFQLGVKAKFLAYGGLATSTNFGESFLRHGSCPVIERDEGGLYIRAIHGIKHLENGEFQIWYSQGASWELINDKPFPRYSIATLISKDGVNFAKNSGETVPVAHPDEYRIGRSRVFSFNESDHILTFTFGKRDGTYESGYATSTDLANWQRKSDWGLEPSKKSSGQQDIDFDSKHLAYPALIRTSSGDVLCFYNGNDMGNGGIGVAKLLER